jgi:hypothetical protein
MEATSVKEVVRKPLKSLSYCIYLLFQYLVFSRKRVHMFQELFNVEYRREPQSEAYFHFLNELLVSL